MEISLDLDQGGKKLIPIDVSWPFKMPDPPQIGFLKKMFCSTQPKVEPIPLIVMVDDNIKTSHLVCNKNELFVITFKDKDSYCLGKPIRVNMTTNTMPFSLKLNTAAILDSNTISKPQTIIANLLVYDGKILYGDDFSREDIKGHSAEQRIRFKIDINIIPPKIEPKISIDLDSDEIQYSRKVPVKKIGQLLVKPNVNYHFVPEIETNLHLSLYRSQGKKIDDAISLGNKTRIENLVFAQEIFIDMNKLSNPKQDETYEIECTGTFTIKDPKEDSISHSGTINLTHDSFTLLRDMQGAELSVLFDNQVLMASNECNKRLMLKQINFTIGSELMRRYTIVFQNISSDNSILSAGVEVSNFSLKVKTEGAHLIDKKGNDISSQVIKISGRNLAELESNQGLFLPNGIGKESQSILSMVFNPQEIVKIEWDRPDFFLFTIIYNIDFQYIENRDGVQNSNLEKKSFHATLEQRVYLESNPEWLCVDYGTSAIVAVYDGKLLDLNTLKSQLIKRDPLYSKFSDDEFEKDNKCFLSSDILLHEIAPNDNTDKTTAQESSLSSEQKSQVPYNQLAVCLSPTSSMIINQFAYQLPCLKMLVGRVQLPKNPNYDIQYYHKTNDNVERVHANDLPLDDPASLLSVMNVFRESYHTLFRYFILPKIGELEQLNKLVLTYPNTYTPTHLSIIRQIVRKAIPSIRFDQNCFRFVSESDAVAAYYMRHWGEYHEKDRRHRPCLQERYQFHRKRLRHPRRKGLLRPCEYRYITGYS